MLRQISGFALIDALVGIAVLGISVLTLVTVINQTTTNLRAVEQRLATVRALDHVKVWLRTNNAMPEVPFKVSEDLRLTEIVLSETLGWSARYRVQLEMETTGQRSTHYVWVSQ